VKAARFPGRQVFRHARRPARQFACIAVFFSDETHGRDIRRNLPVYLSDAPQVHDRKGIRHG
jgi:hypothetical protein